MNDLTRDELARFHDGDDAVFRRIVESYSPQLLAFVSSFASDMDEAHDLLQDLWQRAFIKRRTFTGSGSLLGWLYAVSRNLGLGAVRQRDARDRSARAAVAVRDPVTPDTAAERADLRRSIREAVRALPDRQRAVVILRILEDKSTKETAARLGCAEGTVKATLHHALKNLQQATEIWVP